MTGTEERTTPDNHIQPKLDLSIWTQENPLDLHRSGHAENSWSNCFSYQSGVPRWILASVLLLAISVLAWICCATTATAPEQHIRRKVSNWRPMVTCELTTLHRLDREVTSSTYVYTKNRSNLWSTTNCRHMKSWRHTMHRRRTSLRLSVN